MKRDMNMSRHMTKPTKWHVRPAKTRIITLAIRPDCHLLLMHQWPCRYDNWAMSWENLFMPYVNNKGADQPVHPRSLISAFVVRCLDSFISLVSISEFSSLKLVSVAELAGLSLTWSQNQKTCFLVMRLNCPADIMTASSEFGTYRLCEQRRFRRACASAQSRQNLRCLLIQAVNQEEPSDRKPDPWPSWMAGHAQLKFVMTECSKTQIRLTGLVWLWQIRTDIRESPNQMILSRIA